MTLRVNAIDTCVRLRSFQSSMSAHIISPVYTWSLRSQWNRFVVQPFRHNVNQTVQYTIRDQWCRKGSLLRTLLILGELIMSRYITAKVLFAVDKGLCGRNVLYRLLLILLRICSQSVRPTPYTTVKSSVLFGTKMGQNINVTVSDTVLQRYILWCMSCHKLTYILRDSCCASYTLYMAHWFLACFSLGLCFVTVNCFPQWTRTSTSAHGAPLLWRWRLCSWELSNDRPVLTNSEYLSAVVRRRTQCTHTHICLLLRTHTQDQSTYSTCVHALWSKRCYLLLWRILSFKLVTTALPPPTRSGSPSPPLPSPPLPSPPLPSPPFLLVVFMDEAGLPEESHESLKVDLTTARVLVVSSRHKCNRYTGALCYVLMQC